MHASKQQCNNKNLPSSCHTAAVPPQQSSSQLVALKRFFDKQACSVPVGEWNGMERISGCDNEITKTITHQQLTLLLLGSSFKSLSCAAVLQQEQQKCERRMIDRTEYQLDCLPKKWPDRGGGHDGAMSSCFVFLASPEASNEQVLDGALRSNFQRPLVKSLPAAYEVHRHSKICS